MQARFDNVFTIIVANGFAMLEIFISCFLQSLIKASDLTGVSLGMKILSENF